MRIRKARKVEDGGHSLLLLEIDGVPGVILDEQKRLSLGLVTVLGEARRLFPPIRVPAGEGRELYVDRGGSTDPELVRLAWEFVLSNIAKEDWGILPKPPREVLDTPIDNRWFEE